MAPAPAGAVYFSASVPALVDSRGWASAVRIKGSPGTDDPSRVPLLEGFEAAGSILGDVEGYDDVVGHRPPFPRCLGVVDSAQARESHWCHGYGARSCRGVCGVAEEGAGCTEH